MKFKFSFLNVPMRAWKKSLWTVNIQGKLYAHTITVGCQAYWITTCWHFLSMNWYINIFIAAVLSVFNKLNGNSQLYRILFFIFLQRNFLIPFIIFSFLCSRCSQKTRLVSFNVIDTSKPRVFTYSQTPFFNDEL